MSGYREHPCPSDPMQRSTSHPLSRSCQNPPATCHHGRRYQPLAHRFLDGRYAVGPDSLFPLRSPTIPGRMNSPPVSNFGLPADDMDGNQIIGNYIARNLADEFDTATPGRVGININ